MKNPILSILVIALALTSFTPVVSYSQDYESWSDYEVEGVYERVEPDSKVLTPEGEEIDYIYVKTDIKEGLYEIEISEVDDDIYEVEGEDYYLNLDDYYGYASYDDGILEISRYGGGTFYEKP